jgi:hypothetical protein
LCSFDDPQFNVSTRDQVYDDLLRVHAAPNVSDEDKANGGVPYATNFVANWGNEDGQRLMPGALDYTVYRVVDDKRASRLFGRESWDLMLAAAVGLPVEGLEPLGIRRSARFGTSSRAVAQRCCFYSNCLARPLKRWLTTMLNKLTSHSKLTQRQPSLDPLRCGRGLPLE